MKYAYLLIFMWCCNETMAQEWKLGPGKPLHEYPYLKFKDSLSVSQILEQIRQNNDWSGTRIGRIPGFNVFQFPLDGMKCIVPDQDNPAMADQIIFFMQGSSLALMPNGIKTNK
jgi:hypothetical protein